MQILIDEPDHLEFTIKTHSTVINTLRRLIFESVKTMAIHRVEMRENSSILPDEFIAHRVSLLPIISDTDCTFECNFTATTNGQMLTSSDLTSEQGRFAHAQVPIVQLNKDQTVKFTAHARFGTGQEHSRWIPVNKCYFYELPNGTFKFIIHGQHGMNVKDIIRQAIDEFEKLRIPLP